MRGTRLLTKELFIDTDCISAFLWVGNESLLSQLYPGKVVMPKPVYDEIDRPNLSWMKARVDILVDAYKRGIIDENQGSSIWANMLRKRRRLGAASFSDYLSTHS